MSGNFDCRSSTSGPRKQSKAEANLARLRKRVRRRNQSPAGGLENPLNFEALENRNLLATIADLSVTSHGDEAVPTDIVIAVTLDAVNSTASPITFDLALVDGTTTSGSDYTDVSGAAAISVAVGSDMGSLTVPVIDDGLLESLELLSATISSPSDPSVSIGIGTARAFIADDDTATVALINNDFLAAESPLDHGQFTVDLGGINNTAAAISVGYGVTGSATGGADYSALSGSVDIPVGSQTATIDVTVIDDTVEESLELVIVTLSGTSNTAVGVDSTSHSVTIVDGDRLQVTNVKVGSTSWTAAFNAEVDPTSPVGFQGISIPTGAAQDDTISQSNIDTVYVEFSRPVDLASLTTANIKLHGLNGTPTISGITYDAGSNTARLSLSGAIVNDRLRVEVTDDVKTPFGFALDGEWVDGSDTFNSGNYAAGGDFNFKFNVLPGDVLDTSDPALAVVDILDASVEFATLVSGGDFDVAIGEGSYTTVQDIDGNGLVNIFDASILFFNLGETLPVGSPGGFGGFGGFSGGLGGGLGDFQPPRDLTGNDGNGGSSGLLGPGGPTTGSSVDGSTWNLDQRSASSENNRSEPVALIERSVGAAGDVAATDAVMSEKTQSEMRAEQRKTFDGSSDKHVLDGIDGESLDEVLKF